VAGGRIPLATRLACGSGVTFILELIPVNPDVDEAEHVAHEDGPERDQRPEIGFVRDFEFQHHDEDGDDAVAEGFETILSHNYLFGMH
jgi:hypothetical protein